MKIYVNFKIPKTVREFLKAYFSVWNGSSHVRNITTYSDKACTEVQCTASRNRSFREVCDCVQTYFPNITDKTIFRILLTLNLKNSSGQYMYLYPSFCGDVNRPVMMYYNSKPAYYSIINNTHTGIDKMSWKDIFGMFKLDSEAKVLAFIEKYKDR